MKTSLLSDVRTYFTSFGQMERMVEVLSVDDTSGETEIRVTEQEFDQSGRVIAVWSGPALPDSDRVDPSQARREIELRYEMETGRVEVESYGGLYGEPPVLRKNVVRGLPGQDSRRRDRARHW